MWKWVMKITAVTSLVVVFSASSLISEVPVVAAGSSTGHYQSRAVGDRGVLGDKQSFPILNLIDDGKIVFVSSHTGSDDIFIMNADGSQQKQLTDSPNGDSSPRISPDGNKIVYSAAIGPDDMDIIVMNADE
jgi:hypothetical protein